MSTARRGCPRWLIGLLGAAALGGVGLDLAGVAGAAPWQPPYSVFAVVLLAAMHRCELMRRAHQAEAAAEDSTPRDAKAEPALPILMATIDNEHRCVDATPALAEWLNADQADLVGLPVDDAFGPLQAPTLSKHIDAALAGERQRVRLCYLRAMLPERWVQIELVPQAGSDGKASRCVLFAMDVTTEQQAFVEAQRGERRLRTIMDQIPVTVSYIDADLRYRYINRAQEQWLGKLESEVVGHEVREVAGDAVWADVEPRLRTALAGEEVPLERKRVDRHGNPVWHSGRHVPDINDEGQVVGV